MIDSMAKTALELLKKHWHHEAFRNPQAEIIEAVVDGHDTLVLMPTGGGKSLCYQIPALMMEGVCLVVSPLIALMKDQVENLREKHIKAACIVSDMTAEQQSNVLTNCSYGGVKLLYVSPERLKSRTFTNALQNINISMIAVDEAHCISQWGYDFRPSYLEIAEIRQHFPSVPMIALTATATPMVADDICRRLSFRNERRFVASFYRDNLAYMVFHEADKHTRLLRIIKKVNGSGIVYAGTQRRAKELSDFLNANGVVSGYYHAGLSKRDRDIAQNNWMDGKVQVIVATNAFGMGIDKPNVRYVVHTYIPATIEAYFQEAGRAGRDGNRAYAVILYNNGDIEDLQRNVETSYPDTSTIKAVYNALCYHNTIALGNGENEEYLLQVEELCKKYHFERKTMWAALGLLERDGLICLPAKDNAESQLMIKVGREEIYSFMKQNPRYASMIESLMRLYGGVFSGLTPIDEHLVAKTSGLEAMVVPLMLSRLEALNMVIYKKGVAEQTVIFTAPRCNLENVPIGGVDYAERKKQAIQRKDAMVSYIRENETCRSIKLLQYFGEQSEQKCGCCDICITHTKEQNAKVEAKVMQLLTDGPMTIQQILAQFEDINERTIRSRVRAMVDARMIGIDRDMRLYI